MRVLRFIRNVALAVYLDRQEVLLCHPVSDYKTSKLGNTPEKCGRTRLRWCAAVELSGAFMLLDAEALNQLTRLVLLCDLQRLLALRSLKYHVLDFDFGADGRLH